MEPNHQELPQKNETEDAEPEKKDTVELVPSRNWTAELSEVPINSIPEEPTADKP